MFSKIYEEKKIVKKKTNDRMGRSSVVVEKNTAHFSEEKKKPLIRLFTRILVGKSNKWGCKRIVDNAHFSCTVSEYTFKKFQIHRF